MQVDAAYWGPWLETRLPKTTDRFKKISPKMQIGNRKALHSHSTARPSCVFYNPPHTAKLNYSFSSPLPPNAMLAKLIRRTVLKKKSPRHCPSTLHFGGGGGEGWKKTVIKFCCGLGATRVRSALTLYTVFVMFTTPQPSDCDLAKDQRASLRELWWGCDTCSCRSCRCSCRCSCLCILHSCRSCRLIRAGWAHL